MNQAFKYYRENSAVAIAVDMIAEAVEEIKPVLRVNDEYTKDHDVIRIITAPNGYNDYKEFIGTLMRYYLLTHNSYLLALGNYKFPPLELYPISPMSIAIYPNVDGYTDAYYMSSTVSDGQYRRKAERGKITKFINENGLAELYHIMGFSSLVDNVQADSPLTAVLGDIQHIIKGNAHNIGLLENGASPSLWVDFQDNPGDEELMSRRQHIHESVTGPENAGKPIVTRSDGGAGAATNIKDLTINNKDMDYSKLNDYANFNIFKRYGVPLPLVSLQASTFNNFQNAILYFYEKTIIPNINTVFGGMSKFLISKYSDLDGTDAIITFNPNEIPVLMTKKLQEIKTRREANIETANELRSMLSDRDPVDGGDDIYIPGSMKGIGEEEPEIVTEESIRRDLGLDEEEDKE